MSTNWDNNGISFLMSNSYTTEFMDIGFVATSNSSSSLCPSRTEELDQRKYSMSGGSPFVINVLESSPLIGGGKKCLTEILPCSSRSPLLPDGHLFDFSSLASEPVSSFNNSIIEIFYGAKVSTPNKEERVEPSESLSLGTCMSTEIVSEKVIQALNVQKPASPMWEISEINSAQEENTPTLDVSISDLRFSSGSEREPPPNPQVPAAVCAQWFGVTHKDVGRSFLKPFHFQRQLSASEIPIQPTTPLLCSFHLSADDLGGEGQLKGTT